MERINCPWCTMTCGLRCVENVHEIDHLTMADDDNLVRLLWPGEIPAEVWCESPVCEYRQTGVLLGLELSVHIHDDGEQHGRVIGGSFEPRS